MHILVIDGGHVEAEFRAKFGPGHAYVFLGGGGGRMGISPPQQKAIEEAVSVTDVAFCFADINNSTTTLGHFLLPVVFPVFAEILWDDLRGITYGMDTATFGFCGLPTLLNRPLLEVSLYHEADREKLAETCAALATDYRVVADRVGLVTPRVICQIINEAYYTVQEGTASRADVDLGMKLGTNYPHGPFAWAAAIGIQRVYAVLEALWTDTHDGRYKVCPLLKKEALTGS